MRLRPPSGRPLVRVPAVFLVRDHQFRRVYLLAREPDGFFVQAMIEARRFRKDVERVAVVTLLEDPLALRCVRPAG